MKKHYHYLVVDDDSTSNLICNFTIQRFDKEARISLFRDPLEALNFIEETGFQDEICILFLDVNMPTLSGFEFLILFEKLPKEVREQYWIYMLTSSIEDFSSKAKEFTAVKDFLSKPLKLPYLEKIQQEVLAKMI
ncbi:response regulator [Salinimicrobium oceani]|uniref:Response regulator n=1 Tax=Salinimicrobium oceani TaxID=2722702 RepID=A0ABX1CXP9_9FLAO|nr:response regulator [Salinimicrobium oceani]NJW53046.1 response regulator [Salinimicrobium oceani]